MSHVDFNLDPISRVTKAKLPPQGDEANVPAALVYDIYRNSPEFIESAAQIVSYVYKSLGGDILDIELDECQVYVAHEMATLEWSYLVNLYQAKDIMSNLLGSQTTTFDSEGQSQTGLTDLALKYPRFSYGLARRIGNAVAAEAGFGPDVREYKASIDLVAGQQDYDLQALVAADADFPFVGNQRIQINRVYFRSVAASWVFFSFYGGMNTLGNLSSYGQYKDDSTFQVVPVWQNKLQAMAYEDTLWTRTSHYSYELKGNRIRLFPTPGGFFSKKLWFDFVLPDDVWSEEPDRTDGTGGSDGVNNINTVPFENLPYESINSMGKHWIRRWTLALAKEMLSHTRGKIATVPIPGGEVTLNYSQLADEAKQEKENLREEIKEILTQTSYLELMKTEAEMLKNTEDVWGKVPLPIFRK